MAQGTLIANQAPILPINEGYYVPASRTKNVKCVGLTPFLAR